MSTTKLSDEDEKTLMDAELDLLMKMYALAAKIIKRPDLMGSTGTTPVTRTEYMMFIMAKNNILRNSFLRILKIDYEVETETIDKFKPMTS